MAPLRPLALLVCSHAAAKPMKGDDSAYQLVWNAAGANFFDGFDFMTNDENFGAAAYLDHQDATKAGVIEAHDSHAILRTGARVGELKRESVKLQAKKGWQHFFMQMRFSHLPSACGLWPAFWFLGLDREWPQGGELDIMEWANDGPQQVSFHVGKENNCTLNKFAVNAYGEMPDLNNMDYDCTTEYSKGKLGCAPNRGIITGAELSRQGGVVAIESTPEYMKIFHIPESELPDDIDTAEPNPSAWDQWIVSYFPFALSEEMSPGSCPRPWDIVSPLHLLININLCGEWAGPIWPVSGSCFNKMGPKYPEQCSIIDPIGDPADLNKDCCTQFVIDANGEYGTEEYLRENAFFNISYLRVYEKPALPQASRQGDTEIVV